MANTQSLIPPNINYGKLSADEYDPNAIYSAGDLRIHDNILYKANQAISVAEPWTPAHWDATTIAAELSALNSRSIIKRANILVTFENGAVTIPISDLGIEQAPNLFFAQNIYNSGSNYNDSFTIQIGTDTVIIYGRTGNDQLINGSRRLGLLMVFD